MEQKIKIAILISGNGSNMNTILSTLRHHPKAHFCCVISSNDTAAGIGLTHQYALPCHIADRKAYPNTTKFEEKLLSLLSPYGIDLIILAGFMCILSASFLDQCEASIINIHPSLLPQYKGLNTHQQAIDSNEKTTGSTVHWVTKDLDSGPIIRQTEIMIDTFDTAETLQKKLHPLEHKLYVSVIQDILNDSLPLPQFSH